jgi:5-formyltetrahydrofolate cyclo-ligase
MNKEELRKIYLEKREHLSSAEIDNISEHICKNFFNNFTLDQVKTIHIFLPITEKNEINTWPIIQRIRIDFPKIKIVIPRTDFTTNSMKHILLEDNTEFKKNKYGIPEPTKGRSVKEKDIDMVLVPLLVMDTRGHRIGYGKGIYDRFLAECKDGCIKTGLSFHKPLQEISADIYDVPLNYCVTADDVYNFGD